MKGPHLVVDSSSFVEIIPAITVSLQSHLPCSSLCHLPQQSLVLVGMASACPAKSTVMEDYFFACYAMLPS